MNGKIRFTVRFAHDPKALISERSSQPMIRLADYVSPSTNRTKTRQAFW